MSVSSPGPPPRKLDRFIVGCAAAGLLVRLTLSAISLGSNDALTWYKFSIFAQAHGILQTYGHYDDVNHPYLTMAWADLAGRIGGATGFAFVFKLPFIAADIGSIFVAARLARQLGGDRAARWASAAVAFSPIAILISAYHCNTDAGYAFFVLLSAEALMRGSFFSAGLALGAAINIKLIPVFLIPLIFSFARRWRDARRIFLGLALWVIPFVPLLIHPSIVKTNMLHYNSQQDRWGVLHFLAELYEFPTIVPIAHSLVAAYRTIGRFLVVIAVLVLTFVSWRYRRWSAVQLYLLASSIFLIFASGFGLQYLVLPLPMMAVVSLRAAWQYSVLAGLFAGSAYCLFLQQHWPLLTFFSLLLPRTAALFGLICWYVLIQLSAGLIAEPRGDRFLGAVTETAAQ